MFRQLTMIPLKYHIRELRDTKKLKRSSGSITLEAAIFLSLFILFYMVFMNLIQIARAQVILQYTINEVAKEVSACGYVLTKTGIVDKRVQTSQAASEFENKTTEMVDAIIEVGNKLGSGDAIGAVNAAYNAGNQVNNYFADTDELLNNILGLVKTKGADIVSDFVIQELVKSEVEKQIDMMSYKGADKYLKDLGIENGLNGLEFGETSWSNTTAGGMPVLEVAVVYEIDCDLGFIKLEPRRFKLCAKTALW